MAGIRREFAWAALALALALFTGLPAASYAGDTGSDYGPSRRVLPPDDGDDEDDRQGQQEEDEEEEAEDEADSEDEDSGESRVNIPEIDFDEPEEGSALPCVAEASNDGAESGEVEDCPAEVPEIRVLLQRGGPAVTVGAPGGVTVGEGSESWKFRDTVRVSRSGGRVKLVENGARSGKLSIRPSDSGSNLRWEGKSWAGELALMVQGGDLLVINRLPLEEYLRGVLPAEMPPGWHEEALRAQAIAARTYALSRMRDHAERPYHVVSTVGDQVYRGAGAYDRRTDRAVRSTRGLVALHRGEVITAYFSSDAGAMTKAGSAPYLKPVPAYNPDSPHSNWRLSLSPSELVEKLDGRGGELQQPLEITLEHNEESGRVERVTVTGAAGNRSTLSGSEFRKLLGYNRLKSTDFRMLRPGGGQQRVVSVRSFDPVQVAGAGADREAKVREVILVSADGSSLPNLSGPSWVAGIGEEVDRLTFIGSGWGHGTGLSQWGAKRLAEEGMSGERIVGHFYTGIRLATAWGEGGTLDSLPETRAAGTGSSGTDSASTPDWVTF